MKDAVEFCKYGFPREKVYDRFQLEPSIKDEVNRFRTSLSEAEKDL